MLYLYLCHALCSFLYCVHVIFVILRLIKKLGHLKKCLPSGLVWEHLPRPRGQRFGYLGDPGPIALTVCSQDIGGTVPARDWGQVSSTVWFAVSQVMVLPHYPWFKASCNSFFFFFFSHSSLKSHKLSWEPKKKKKSKKPDGHTDGKQGCSSRSFHSPSDAAVSDGAAPAPQQRQ